MKRFTINAGIALALGLGLTLVLLWLLSTSTALPVARAAELRVCSTCTYTTIQDAVDAAGDGDVIKVAAGTYISIEARAGVTQVVYISKSVTIRGGYTTAFTDPPDPAANPTTLDAQGQGRVFYVTGDISPTIEGLRMTGGDAVQGGGVYAVTATVTIRNNQVFSNSAAYGGGLFLGSSPNATLSANNVYSNTAAVGGGLFLSLSSATLSANNVYFNFAQAGGGLYLVGSDATLSANTVTYNTATYGSGGLYLVGSDATLSANTVTYNTATYGSGGLDLYESDATLINNVVADNRTNNRGSGLYIGGSSPRLLHNTIARNSGGDGSGVYVTDHGAGNYSTVALTNTILFSHTVGISVTAGNTTTLESTLWNGNTADWGGTGTINRSNDYTGDPAFVNPDAGDYHIGPTSAAIDKGVGAGVTTDIDGETRPYGSAPDLGADEQSFRAYLPTIQRSFVITP